MAILIEINPVLPVQTVSVAIAYYVGKLGFALRFQDTKDNPRYAGVSRGNVELHLQWHDPAEWVRIDRPSIRIRVDDVDALFKEYENQNVFDEQTQLRDTSWGTREFAFFDPDLNGLTFYVDR